MKRILTMIGLCAGLLSPAYAQVDTLNVTNLTLNMAALKEGQSSYAVFFEDSTGRRLSTADIWDRTIAFVSGPAGQKQYQFDWKWYHRDSLMAHVTATGLLPSLAQLTHRGDYKGRGVRSYVFNGPTVTIPADSRKTAKDSSFRVVMNPPAFAFPMDLEILPLVPFRKVGQQFAIAFYEPGSPSADYYKLTVTGREDLTLNRATAVSCWLLRIDYGRGSYATFWIADKSREVLKMQEYFRGRYRYKVKLY